MRNLGKKNSVTKTIKGKRGFTLIELIIVIAIVVALVAMFLPLALNKIDESNVTRAKADVDALATAVTSFFSSLGNFPSCDGADCNPLNDAANNLRFLAVGTGTGDLSTVYPADSGALWSLTTQDDGTVPARNNAFNHLAMNNPNANATPNEVATDYVTTRWNGPYISKLSEDPWGAAYIVHIGSMQNSGCPVGSTGAPPACTAPATGRQGWILSAGPNGNLDTAPTATTLSADDIGYIFFTQ